MPDISIDKDTLEAFARQAFEKAGMSAEDARTEAEVLIWANLRGVDSHGVQRNPRVSRLHREGVDEDAARDPDHQGVAGRALHGCRPRAGSDPDGPGDAGGNREGAERGHRLGADPGRYPPGGDGLLLRDGGGRRNGRNGDCFQPAEHGPVRREGGRTAQQPHRLLVSGRALPPNHPRHGDQRCGRGKAGRGERQGGLDPRRLGAGARRKRNHGSERGFHPASRRWGEGFGARPGLSVSDQPDGEQPR